MLLSSSPLAFVSLALISAFWCAGGMEKQLVPWHSLGGLKVDSVDVYGGYTSSKLCDQPIPCNWGPIQQLELNMLIPNAHPHSEVDQLNVSF